MADHVMKQEAPDKSRIKLEEEWEVAYWTKELGRTESDLQKAIEEVGNGAESVRKYLETIDAG